MADRRCGDCGLTKSTHVGTKILLRATRRRRRLGFCRRLSRVPHQSPDRLQVAGRYDEAGSLGWRNNPAVRTIPARDRGGLGGTIAPGAPGCKAGARAPAFLRRARWDDSCGSTVGRTRRCGGGTGRIARGPRSGQRMVPMKCGPWISKAAFIRPMGGGVSP